MVKNKLKPTKRKPFSSLPLFNQRIFELMEFVIANKIQGVDSKDGFFKSIGLSNANNYHQIRYVNRSFTIDDAYNAITQYGIDANFLFKKDHLQIYQVNKPLAPLLQLKSAVAMVSQQYASLKMKQVHSN